jgi:hypothetical protein
LREYRKDTVKAINEMWDEAKGAYADSVHENGDVSEQTCQHTSFLALLYDIAGDEHREAAVQNCLNPPEEMTRVGSPFALMYFYEALDKEGLQDEIVQHIRDAYQPMLDDGATTVWESFPSGSIKYGDFPTRSHCHGWSSAPIYFLNRIVLGIEQTAIGGTSFTVSPRLNGLRWARGVSASAHGPIEVDWRLEGNTLEVRSSAPEAVTLRFRKNETHEGLEVRHNGRKVK